MKLQGWALASSLTVIMAASTMPTIGFAHGLGGGGGDQQAQEDRGGRTERGGRRPRRERGGQSGGVDTTRGMADAPKVIAAANLTCTPAAAGFLGETNAADGTKNAVYELACSEGPGYFVVLKADGTLDSGYDCFALKSGAEQTGQEGAQLCRLPQNSDPLAGFKRVAQPAVANCTIDQARYLGASPTSKQSSYEVGCANAPGVILRIASPGAPAGTATNTVPCATLPPDGAVKCEYTTQEEVLAPLRTLIAASDKACPMTNGRYIGVLSNGETAYEAKCGDTGFMVMANAQGAFARTVDCARATGIAGGCTLTDAIEAQNAEASVYKGLATKAGFDCDVDKYRLLGMEGAGAARREVVELACKNQPEGLIAFFPTTPTGPTNFYDCTKIGTRNAQLRCSLTDASVIHARLTQDVQRNGKSCQVTGYRAAGLTTRGKTEFVEVSCASGGGLMVEYPADPAPKPLAPATGVFTCAESANINGGCKLPGARG